MVLILALEDLTTNLSIIKPTRPSNINNGDFSQWFIFEALKMIANLLDQNRATGSAVGFFEFER